MTNRYRGKTLTFYEELREDGPGVPARPILALTPHHGYTQRPPSTSRHTPVMKSASSEAR
jgi:hypothetical protein